MKAFLFLILAACLAVSGRAQTTNKYDFAAIRRLAKADAKPD
jgi:hypothetical protein